MCQVKRRSSHVKDRPHSAVALSQTEPAEPHFRSVLEQGAEAGLLSGDHGEASRCFAQATLPGHCEDDDEMGPLARPYLMQRVTAGS